MRRVRWRTLSAALIAGGLPVLVFPRIDLGWLAWVVLVPWLALIRSAAVAHEPGTADGGRWADTLRAWRAPALIGWLGGAGYTLASEYWLAPNLTVFFPVAAAIVGVVWAPWAVLTSRMLARASTPAGAVRALIVVPAGWMLVEAARSWPALGGPWNPLGASQWQHPALLGLAAIGAVWLVGAAVVAVNTGVLLLIVGSGLKARVLAALVIVLALVAGPCWFALHKPSGSGTARIALIQPGLTPPGPAQRLDASAALTANLASAGAAARPDLVVWGESSVGYDLDSHPQILARLTALSNTIRAPLLVDVDASRPDASIAKVSVLLDAHGVVGQYTKTRLVPFGEYIPLRPLLGWLHLVSKAASVNRTKGTGLTVLTAGGIRFGPLTCFESSFPDMARTVVVRGAQLVVYQSSTSSFQGSYAQEQQAALLAVRAAETGRPVVQAALTGDSTAYDAAGRRIAILPSTARQSLTVTVPLATSDTPYDRFGNTLLLVPLLIVAAVIVDEWRRSAKAHSGSTTSRSTRSRLRLRIDSDRPG